MGPFVPICRDNTDGAASLLRDNVIGTKLRIHLFPRVPDLILALLDFIKASKCVHEQLTAQHLHRHSEDTEAGESVRS